MEPKTFEIKCTGYSVKADWYEAADTNEIVLSLIGWTSNRKRYNDILSAICSKTGKSALVFDYSGHGDSPFDVNTTRPAQHFLEVICVFDYIKKNHPNAKITVMGSSYGGFLATQLTKYRAFENLILRAPAIYRPQDFYNLAPDVHRTDATHRFRTDIEGLAKHPLLARASTFKGRTLIMVHENDEAVPRETTDAYIKAFSPDVYIAKGLPHGLHTASSEQIQDYQNAINNWLNK